MEYEHTSYLDDPDHDWDTLEESQLPIISDLEHIVQDGDPDKAILVLEGYAGLRQRHPNKPANILLATSMVWCYG